MATINIDGPATVGLLELMTNRGYEASKGGDSEILFDFSNCPFIEVTALSFLIAFISQRSRNGLSTKIKLPLSKDVRDFLRIWNFPEALKISSGIPFSTIVVNEDLIYFGENFSLENIKYAKTINYDNRLIRLLANNFFSFISYSIDPFIFTPRIAFDECQRWQDRLISSVLNNHLIGPDSYVSDRIIFEALTNTLRHPDAKLVQTASFFQAKKDKNANIRGHFTIVIWDDGLSMIDTLRNALKVGKKIRSTNADELYTNYLFIVKDSKGSKISEDLIGSDYSPEIDCTDEKLLLTECFPGITCDIEGRKKIESPMSLGDMDILNQPGMGLYILVNAAVCIFGGEIAYRTKNVFMNIKKAPKRLTKDFNYRVKAIRYNGYSPNFLGNMITIRLPIYRSHSRPEYYGETRSNEECSNTSV